MNQTRRHPNAFSVVHAALWIGIGGISVTPASALGQDLEYIGGDSRLEYLGQEVARLADLANGTVGVAAIHLQTGRGMYLNRRVRFPMASTYKVPIAVEILHRVDRGTLRLDSLINLERSDVYRTAGIISDFLDDPGVMLSVRNLLELMLQLSDNNATDVMFRTAGGSEAITARMQAVGAGGIRVDRPTWGIISAFLGRTDVTEDNPVLPDEFRSITDQERSDQARARNTANFNNDSRDTSTPEAIATLLSKIWKQEILSPENSELLIDIMYRCRTGEGRLKGLLPPATRVAHKTGTIGETTNDVGIIELPNGAGNVVTVVYIKESKLEDNAAMEPVIAQIARAVHDFFVFNP